MPAGFERDPVAPYAILFKTHFWDDFVQRRFDFLKSRARGGDVWVIVDETHGRVSGINHDRVVRTCEANLKSIGLGGYPESKLNWYNNDYQLIYFYRQYPKYIFYITIEYDAVFNGDFDVFANTAIERETDLVVHPISTPADQWCWRPTCEEVWPANRILHQLLCISGFSNRAVAQIDAVRVAHSKLYASGQLTKWPFCEGFVPTALHEAGFKLEPLANYGGTGFYEWWPPYHESQLGDVPATNFIHPVLTGRRYIDSILHQTGDCRQYFDHNSDLRRRLEYEAPENVIPALFEVFRHNGDRQALAGLYSIVAEAGMGDYQLNFGAALAELIKPQDEQNLARHKLTYQSSTAPRSKSRNPVAGVARAVSGVLNGDSGFHTKVEIRPWWMVDLGDVCLIRQIRVFDRVAWPDRGTPLTVWTSLDLRTWEPVAAPANDQRSGDPLVIDPSQRRIARFVRLELADFTCLHLDQVEVLGVVVHLPYGREFCLDV